MLMAVGFHLGQPDLWGVLGEGRSVGTLGGEDPDALSEGSGDGYQHLGLDFEAGKNNAIVACVTRDLRDRASLSG